MVSILGLILFIAPILNFISHGYEEGKSMALKTLVLSLLGLGVAFLAAWCNHWMRRVERLKEERNARRFVPVCYDVSKKPAPDFLSPSL